MIRTIINPSAAKLQEGFLMEDADYEDTEIELAAKDIFNRMHEAWVESGEIWFISNDDPKDCVLLSSWFHSSGPNHTVVMEVENPKGEIK